MSLMFSKFDSTSSLTKICYGCIGGCGRDSASSGGGDKVRLGSWIVLGLAVEVQGLRNFHAPEC
ncbi:unnamed protein product [Prunus armeniaca]